MHLTRFVCLSLTILVCSALPAAEDGATPVEKINMAPGFQSELLYSVPSDQQGSWVAMTIDPERSSLGDLARQITELRRDGADSRSAMTSFLSRLSKPMSTLVMPLLGAIAGFGVSRQGNQLARASIGAVLGFGYFVTENLMLAIGKLGVAPPMIAAFFPLALFLVVGFAILLAMEN